MTDRKEIYDVGAQPTIEVIGQAGDILLKPSKDGKVTITLSGNADSVDLAQIDATSDAVTVRANHTKGRFFSKRVDIVVKAPDVGDIKISNGSGDVRVRIPSLEANVSTAAGDVRIEQPARGANVRVGSGDVYIAGVEGAAEINTANGDVRVDAAGEVEVNTASGDVRLGSIARSADIKSVSGDVVVKHFSGTDLTVKTMSGDASLGLAPGMEVKASIRTMSGDLRNRIKKSEGPRTGSMNLRVKSFSGDVTLRSAT